MFLDPNLPDLYSYFHKRLTVKYHSNRREYKRKEAALLISGVTY